MSLRDLTASGSIARPHGSPGAKLLYLALCYLTTENNEKCCCATLSELSAATEQSTRSLKKNLKLLRQGGHIKVMPGLFGVTFYEVLKRPGSRRSKATLDLARTSTSARHEGMLKAARCA